MIREYVVCDWCADKYPLEGGMVPGFVYSHQGKHYCCTYCLSRADRNLTLSHWPTVKADV